MSFAEPGMRAPAMGWNGLSREPGWSGCFCAVMERVERIQSHWFTYLYIYCIDITDNIGFLFGVATIFLWNIHLLKQES